MKKLLLAASLVGLVTGSAMVQSADQAVVDRYSKTCAVCHTAGAAGAPKTGDAAAWAPRLEKGMDTLVSSVDKGMNAMPPKGMCFDCKPADFEALIEYMAAGK
ncbi:cytochrome c5 family protein [Oceanicoccus sp. KOV_DT_Chl]|uniref:c-type cytochrome n=1 Tax=Oceanicoccus sp. KOV_DT_Chl TaxID=1904639 RepID=UPI000C7E150D|nr:c-type cytochrome [Oceanicoccus sp. KOV_DT_Chl]